MAKTPTEVNLIQKVKTENKWHFVPVQFSSNGKIKAGSGTFYLEWRERGKRKRKAVGKNPTEALTARNRLQHRLEGVAIGIKNAESPNTPSDKSLASAVEEYLEEKRQSRKKKSHAAYSNSLTKFQTFTSKKLADITRKDLVAFVAYCRDDLKLSRRSAFNHFTNVVSFLKANNIKLALKGDWPTYVEEPPEVYETDELNKFFAVCSEAENLYFQFFLMTGMREQEVMHVCWSDIKLDAGIVRVSEHPEFNFYPKAYKGREIPIPQKLVDLLRKWNKTRDPKCPLVFPTSGCRPQDHFLEICKRIAENAELESFYLHKFRATFATRHLQNGVDIRTVQAWMGHDDLASTMRYLTPARGQTVRTRVDSSFSEISVRES